MAILHEFGDLPALQARGDTLATLAYNCPLTAVVLSPSEVCELAEAPLCELTGLPIQECCDRGEQPRCQFEVAHFEGLERVT